MRIQHNILAMNAYRNYNTNTSALAKNLEKLSSGYKINRAGDDAAGLAISEKMRAQITGLNAAQKNVKDGISLVKTAEGAMQEIQDMLNRMDYLATQSANGTYDDDVDRKNLQKEVDALKTEIDRISDSANFNGIKLLNGTLETKTVTTAGAAPAISGDFLVNKSQDGVEPTAATKAEYKITLAGVDTTANATLTDVKPAGAAVTPAGADTKATYTTGTFSNATAAGTFKVTVSYTDANGVAQTEEVSVNATTTTAATSAGEIKTAIEGNTKLNNLFSVAIDSGSGLKFESKVAGSDQAYVTGIAVSDDAANTGAAFGAAAANALVKATDAGSVDLSGWAATGTITVNGKEYKQADHNTFDDLKGALEADGLEVTGETDGKNTLIKGAVQGAAFGNGTITGGTTTIADLGNMEIGGKKVKDLFDLKVGGTAKAWDTAGTEKIAVGAELTFTAKLAGEQSAAVNNAFTATGTGAGTLTNATSEIVTVGKNEDSDPDGTKTSYALTFNFNNLAGNQRVKIGDKTYELSTKGALNDATSGNTLIDISGLDPTSAAGKLAIAQKIHTAISGGLGTDYTSTAPTAADFTATTASYSVTFTSKLGNSASNKGNILVYDNPAAITGTYTAGADAAYTDKARPTKVVYSADLTKLALGDKITIGDKTVEIVANNKSNPAQGKLSVADAQNATKLAASFYKQGYAHNISYDSAAKELTITYNQQTGGGSTSNGSTSDTTAVTAASFAGNAGKLEFVPGTPTGSTTTTGSPLTLQIGDTSDPYNQMKVSVGDMHVNAMGTFKAKLNADGTEVKDANGKTEMELDTNKTIAKIDISTRDGASNAIEVIKNAINYVSGIRGDLGAAQNRLEHTANNLSVMAENIQDAESTIRDTDVAEEMMAYTKNNILIQSAQAMLAQANAVPQGVLQLLG